MQYRVSQLNDTVGRTPAPRSHHNGQRRLTVVDDSDAFVDLLRDLFVGRFCVSVPSSRSVNAIANTRPDLLIVDLQYQPIDGLDAREVVRLARSHRDLHNVPIIVCTADQAALADEGDLLARHTGMHLVVKPFAVETLESVVERALAS